MNGLRILKRSGKFYIQKRVFVFWIDLTENNSPPNKAFNIGCPPFATEAEAKEWLSVYIKFKTVVVYPVLKVVVS